MSKGLEALEELQSEWEFNNNLPKGFVDTRVSIIEKELKRLDEYDNMEYSALIESHKKLLKDKKANKKELKALEIIAEKRVDIYLFFDIVNGFLKLEDYNAKHKPITQEEYDLLKEVLL